jgi:Flp pilus assembly pilin Flp
MGSGKPSAISRPIPIVTRVSREVTPLEDAMKPEKELLRSVVQRLLHEDDGMEMVEWAIVGVVFSVAAAGSWSALSANVDTAMDTLGDLIDKGKGKGKGTCCD